MRCNHGRNVSDGSSIISFFHLRKLVSKLLCENAKARKMDWKQACFRKEPAPSSSPLCLPELLRKLKQVKDKLTCSNSLHIKEQDNRKKQLCNF